MPSEILPKIFLSNCFEVLLGGGVAFAVPEQCSSPGTLYYQSWLILSSLQEQREMWWWVWVLGSASKEQLSSRSTSV